MSTAPLPVIDILKNVTTLNNFLSALSKVTLPEQLKKDSNYKLLITNFNNWRYLMWEEYFEGLIDTEIVAQSKVIKNLFDDGITEMQVFHDVFYQDKQPVPQAIESVDQVSSLIANGQQYVSGLQDAANSIKGADEALVKQYMDQANTLQAQFEKQEADLTDKSISTAKNMVACAIDVAVAVGTEGEAIEPLVKGITTLGQNAIDELVLTQEIHQTLLSLEDTWGKLDQASMELAKMQRLIEQLKIVTDQEDVVFGALSSIADQWSSVVAVTKDPANWAPSGQDQLNEWAHRMSNVSFSIYLQKFTAS